MHWRNVHVAIALALWPHTVISSSTKQQYKVILTEAILFFLCLARLIIAYLKQASQINKFMVTFIHTRQCSTC